MPLARVAIALLVAGCSASAPQPTQRDPTAAGAVSADPEAAAASSQGDGSPGRDAPSPVLGFFQALDEAVRAGDIATAVSFFDSENRASQRAMGIEDAQYLAEGIGLHQEQRLAGHDVPEPDPWDARAELAAVTRLVVKRVVRDEAEPGCVRAIGRVELRDGRAYAFDLPVCPGGPRGFRIVPPVG